ncbi:hypothetical protein ACH5RR_030128 [Cinchona calisaya]|uniref:Protein kinase domain-containing protein n=1 Tax=Cinchona calisaya TaxID=153742 RepID=A0ABD2YWY4_9GENT
MFLGLFLVFSLICNVLSLSAQEHSNTSTTCPEYFNCRNFKGLSFPFFNFSLPGCGLCMLDCEGNPSPKLALDSQPEHWFDVKYIDDSVVKLHDPILQSHLDNQICESFSYNIHPRPSPAISYSILNNITLYRCFITPESHPMITDLFSGYKNYDKCDNVGYTVYYQNSSTLQFNGTIPSVCSAFTLPIVSAYDNSSRDDGLFQLLTSDFDLQWHVSDECYNCHEKGLMCQTHRWEKSGCANVKQGKKNWKVILGIVIAGVAAVIIFVAVFLICRPKNGINVAWSFPTRNISDPSPSDLEGGSVYFGVPVFSYSELEEATNNFDVSKELGDGGFGTVYFGKLRDGREVAVKRLYEHNFKRMEQFMNEIEILTRLRHRNLVTLYVDISRHRHEINLASLAINRIQRCEFDELLDPFLGYKSDTEILRMTTSVAELAFRCLQLEKDMRPKMEEVLETLKEIQNCKDILVDKKTKTNENTIESRRAMVTSRQSGDIALLNRVNFPSSPSSVADQRVSSSTTTSTSG